MSRADNTGEMYGIPIEDTARQCVGYSMASAYEGVAGDLGLGAQRLKIEQWAAQNSAKLLDVFADVCPSGKRNVERPGLQQALDLTCERKATLVTCSLSRLARSTQEAMRIARDLQEAEADLVLLADLVDTKTPSGHPFFAALTVLARFEHEVLSESTKAVMRRKRAQGQRISGHVPFGFELAADGRTLFPRNDEQEAIALMKGLREKEYTLSAICGELESRETPTKNGKGKWYPSTVRAILQRESRAQEVS